MRLKSSQMVPPGGWTVKMDSGTVIKATGESDAIKLMQRHQKALGEPMSWEDARAILHAQVCARWPHGCTTEAGEIPVNGLNWKGMAKNFMKSVAAFAKGGFKPVSKELATQRAQVCASCPKNQVSPAVRKACPSCRKNIMNDLAESIIAGSKKLLNLRLTTPFDARIRACSICGCDLKLLVQFPLNQIHHGEEEEKGLRKTAPWCWQVQEAAQ